MEKFPIKTNFFMNFENKFQIGLRYIHPKSYFLLIQIPKKFPDFLTFDMEIESKCSLHAPDLRVEHYLEQVEIMMVLMQKELPIIFLR